MKLPERKEQNYGVTLEFLNGEIHLRFVDLKQILVRSTHLG